MSDRVPKAITPQEATRLHEEAGAMTVAEIRRIGKIYGAEWHFYGERTALRKADLVDAFRRWLVRKGAKVQTPLEDR